MKRPIPQFEAPIKHQMKKIKLSQQTPSPATANTAADVLSDENLLYEILKHADERTLGAASCVSKKWNRTAQDERIWELICTKHWTNNMSCGYNQLRSVVLALGGFRRLHAHYLWPLSKSSGCTTASCSASTVAAAVTSSPWPCLPPPPRTVAVANPGSANRRWGKDEWFHGRLAVLKAVSCKVTKHETACLDNQHVFIPFEFDTFGFLAPEAVELLSRVQRVMHSNVMTLKSINVVFKRLGFAIQKGWRRSLLPV